MDVPLSPELEATLTHLASQSGRDAQALVQEAVQRLVDRAEWFVHEVDAGLAAAERGEFVNHDEVGKLLDCRFAS